MLLISKDLFPASLVLKLGFFLISRDFYSEIGKNCFFSDIENLGVLVLENSLAWETKRFFS